MSQKPRPKIRRAIDIWKAYAERILEADNTTYSRRAIHYAKIPHYYIYRKTTRGVEDVINYKTFKKVLETYFMLAKDAIIEGETVPLRYGLGSIEARRIERNFKHSNINWPETVKQPKDENGKISKFIYYTDEDYCRIAWGKVSGPFSCPNVKGYQFVPTPNDSTGKGFVPEFFAALERDVTLKFKYKYYPYT